MSPVENKSRLLGILLIGISVTDVEILRHIKSALNFWQSMLWYNEIYRDIVPLPERGLRARRTIGAAANNETHLLGSSDHLHGYSTGRVPELHRTVYVEADKDCQLDSPLTFFNL